MAEEWKPIEGWPNHEVSNLGRIRSIKVLKPSTPQSGASTAGGRRYSQVMLSHEGRSKSCKVHALVAQAFHGPRPEGMTIDHVDGDRANNKAENLEYVTMKENIQRAIKDGRINKGQPESRVVSKLTKDQAREIKLLLADPEVNMSAVARQFGVSRETIRMIRSGKMWQEV